MKDSKLQTNVQKVNLSTQKQAKNLKLSKQIKAMKQTIATAIDPLPVNLKPDYAKLYTTSDAVKTNADFGAFIQNKHKEDARITAQDLELDDETDARIAVQDLELDDEAFEEPKKQSPPKVPKKRTTKEEPKKQSPPKKLKETIRFNDKPVIEIILPDSPKKQEPKKQNPPKVPKKVVIKNVTPDDEDDIPLTRLFPSAVSAPPQDTTVRDSVKYPDLHVSHPMVAGPAALKNMFLDKAVTENPNTPDRQKFLQLVNSFMEFGAKGQKKTEITQALDAEKFRKELQTKVKTSFLAALETYISHPESKAAAPIVTKIRRITVKKLTEAEVKERLEKEIREKESHEKGKLEQKHRAEAEELERQQLAKMANEQKEILDRERIEKQRLEEKLEREEVERARVEREKAEREAAAFQREQDIRMQKDREDEESMRKQLESLIGGSHNKEEIENLARSLQLDEGFESLESRMNNAEELEEGEIDPAIEQKETEQKIQDRLNSTAGTMSLLKPSLMLHRNAAEFETLVNRATTFLFEDFDFVYRSQNMQPMNKKKWIWLPDQMLKVSQLQQSLADSDKDQSPPAMTRQGTILLLKRMTTFDNSDQQKLIAAAFRHSFSEQFQLPIHDAELALVLPDIIADVIRNQPSKTRNISQLWTSYKEKIIAYLVQNSNNKKAEAWMHWCVPPVPDYYDFFPEEAAYLKYLEGTKYLDMSEQLDPYTEDYKKVLKTELALGQNLQLSPLNREQSWKCLYAGRMLRRMVYDDMTNDRINEDKLKSDSNLHYLIEQAKKIQRYTLPQLFFADEIAKAQDNKTKVSEMLNRLKQLFYTGGYMDPTPFAEHILSIEQYKEFEVLDLGKYNDIISAWSGKFNAIKTAYSANKINLENDEDFQQLRHFIVKSLTNTLENNDTHFTRILPDYMPVEIIKNWP